MKTIGTILTVIIAAFATNVAIASGNLKVNFSSNDADLTVVEISNSKMSNFEIKVNDAYGENLYRLKTTAPGSEFKKRYDFSELEDGIYWYTVKIDKEKVTKRFSVDNGKVEVLNIRKSLEPYFIQRENMLKFSYLNYQNEDVKLFVYGSNNELLTEADLGNNFSINKVVDLSKLKYGDFKVVITNKNDIYEHNFSVN